MNKNRQWRLTVSYTKLMNLEVQLAATCSSDTEPIFVQKSMYSLTPGFLYELVSCVRVGLCTRVSWSLYEVTDNHLNTYIICL